MFEVPRLVRTHYAVRAVAFAYSFLAIGLHLWQREAGLLTWAVFTLQFLVYPHLVYWRASRAAHPARAELDNLYLDALLLGAWVAFLGFPTWIAYGLLASALLSVTVARGLRSALFALGCGALGAAAAVGIGGYHYSPQTSTLVTALCFFGILAYTCAVGHVVYRQNRRIVQGREALRASEARYRLIAENAADLIAMVDPDGRWLYASPSYERLLERADLQRGADAFGRVHPDDAHRARLAVLRVAATGRPREVALRLVDKSGRLRQYRTRVQAPAGDAPPRERILLVSQDVSDLRESEERLLLVGQALEGMTEAVLVTDPDGVVQTVNRAFCEITGYPREEVVGRPEKALRSSLHPSQFHDQVDEAVQREGHWSGTQWNRRKNGSIYLEWRSIRAVRDPGGAATHHVIVFFEADGPKPRDDLSAEAHSALNSKLYLLPGRE